MIAVKLGLWFIDILLLLIMLFDWFVPFKELVMLLFVYQEISFYNLSPNRKCISVKQEQNCWSIIRHRYLEVGLFSYQLSIS